MTPADCLQHQEFCPKCTDCATRQIWQELQDSITRVLESYTLADLVEKSIRPKKAAHYNI